jgi:hypothetical protein
MRQKFFVNRSSMTDRKDPDEPSFAIDFIDEAKSSHLYFQGIWGLPSGLSLYFISGLRVEIRTLLAGWN